MQLVGEHWLCSDVHHDWIRDYLDTFSGFVYVITQHSTGKVYFGRKSFWTKQRRYKTAKQSGNRYSRIHYSESDWRGYRGSSDLLTTDIDAHGWDSFYSQILGVFEGKSGVAYAEAALVLGSGGLLAPERCYNRQSPAIRGYVRLKDNDRHEVAKILGMLRNGHFNCL